jgi:hypothetical protein
MSTNEVEVLLSLGLALRKKAITSPEYEDQLSGRVWENQAAPLIEMYGGNVSNFDVDIGSNGVPP